MKSTLGIFFVILVTGIVNVEANQDFNAFLQRLEPILPAQNVLTLGGEVIEDLKETSKNFKELCMQHEAQFTQRNGKFAPVTALSKTIKDIVDLYKKSAKEHKYILNYLEILDPIGLNVYLTQKKVDESSPNFIDSVEEFQTILYKEMLATDEIRTGIEDYFNRLEKSIRALSTNILPFEVKDNVMEKLKETSETFKMTCYVQDTSEIKEQNYSPVKTLSKVIDEIFEHYKESAKENKDILFDIQAVDPIGLNVHLAKSKVKNSSPDFIRSVNEFRTEMFKKVPIIAGSKYSMNDFIEFTQRIKTIIENPLATVSLPFTLQVNVFANLRATTNEFKYLCAEYYDESKQKNRNPLPMPSLNKTIQYFFAQYKDSMKKKKSAPLLNDIQTMDPIGLHVYLNRKNVYYSSPNFAQAVEDFYAIMMDRVDLFKSRKNNSYLESLKKNRKAQLKSIPENVRKEITSEYTPLSHETMDYFIDIATKQFPNIKMYAVGTYHSIEKYNQHTSSKVNDVQILYDGEVGSKQSGHALCIYYQASSQNVLVYDSLMNDKLEPRQEEIIRKLYPFSKEIVIQKPKTIQGLIGTDSVYAIIYATTLLLNADPIKYEFKLNDIFGDETLYMRFHILDMFANRKLFLMKNEHRIRAMISKLAGPNCMHPKVKQ